MSASFRLVCDDDDCATVMVTGEVEYENAAELVEMFREALTAVFGSPGPEATARVDLSHTDFLDSMGLSALLTCRQIALEKGARFAVVNASAIPYRVISVAGLARTLGMEDTSTITPRYPDM